MTETPATSISESENVSRQKRKSIWCPHCEKITDSLVVGTAIQPRTGWRRRRRECRSCGERFSTVEMLQETHDYITGELMHAIYDLDVKALAEMCKEMGVELQIRLV